VTDGGGGGVGAASASTSTPIFQTATFDCSEQGAYDYTRSGNPTRDALQELCRRVEHATAAFAFTSGMAALAATLRLLRPGDTVLASADIYGGMHRLLRHAAVAASLDVRLVPTWELAAVEAALDGAPGARMLCMESPTNPMMRVSDVRGIGALCAVRGVLLCVDNSVLSPVLCTPLDLGADIVVHSATKYLGGHADAMAGVVCVKDEELARQVAFVQNAEGSGLAPFDSWLVLRGMKTMVLRVGAAQANAVELAEVLRRHPLVQRVHYIAPGDVTAAEGGAGEHGEPGEEGGRRAAEARLHFSQARGGGALLSFETGSVEVSRAFVAAACNVQATGGLFKNTVSFGSTGSLVEMPATMSHASIPAAERAGHLPDDLVRIACGIEDAADLVAGLSKALALAQSAAHGPVRGADRGGVAVQPAVVAGQGSGALPFGVSLPVLDAHAVGVSMPLWSDVVAYEEGNAEPLASGYPRFVFLAPVQQLFDTARELFAAPGEGSMAMPSARAALRLSQFMTRAGVSGVGVHDFFCHGVFAVTFPAADAPTAKLYWQHCGEIVSSRLAEEVTKVVQQTCFENSKGLGGGGGDDDDATRADRQASDRQASNLSRFAAGLPHRNAEGSGNGGVTRTSTNAVEQLRRRVASLNGEDAANAFVFPTGMAAVAAAHRLVKLASQWDETPLRNIVFGFPYLDTLKLNGRTELGGGVVFFGNGDAEDLAALAALLRQPGGERFGAVFCEMPSNPLLRAPPLAALRELCDEFGIVLVVDDSVVGAANVDVLGPDGADVVVSSLTKQFSGENNAMGGSLVLNSQRLGDTTMHARLHARLLRDYEPLLWREDAAALLAASADLEARAACSNANAMRLIGALAAHDAIGRIYHPSTEARELYEPWRRAGVADGAGEGYGALFSLALRRPEHAHLFYDRLDAAKGPGFGSNFTLVCPYTMIAHFNELQWAATYGVEKSLIRCWAGLEDADDLVATFEAALDGL